MLDENEFLSHYGIGALSRFYRSPPADRSGSTQLVHVVSRASAPADAYAAVPYRGRWYWVADGDLRSKL
jgi:hypothetical protein